MDTTTLLEALDRVGTALCVEAAKTIRDLQADKKALAFQVDHTLQSLNNAEAEIERLKK